MPRTKGYTQDLSDRDPHEYFVVQPGDKGLTVGWKRLRAIKALNMIYFYAGLGHRIPFRGGTSAHGAYLSFNKKTSEKSRLARELVLRRVQEGKSIADAVEEAGVARTTYDRWRTRWPDFAVEVDLARGGKFVRRITATPFTEFRKKYLGFDTYYHQVEIIKAIEGAAPQSVTLILVAPETGKSTLIEDWITYKVCYDPNIRITVVSEGQPHARKIMQRVQARLMDKLSPLWRDFGPFYDPGQERAGKPWSSHYFTVFKADHDERDRTVECRGWTSAVAGTRTDYLLIDDITSLRNHSQAERIVQVLRQDFFTRPGKNGHTVLVGTRVDNNDVYERLLGETDEITGEPLVSRSIVLPIMDDEGNSLIPEMWPTEALVRKRAIVGESVWWRNYQQKPRADQEITFSSEVIDGAKNHFVNYGIGLTGGHNIIGLDPALGGGNAFVVWSYTADKMRVIDYQRDFRLGRTEDILTRLSSLASRYRPEDVVVETNAFQRGLAHDDRMQELASLYGFRILPHLTGGGGRSKLDETLGIAQMATDMSKGEIEIPWGDQETRVRMEALLAELMSWRPDVPTRKLRQDIVMAMWFGYIVMKNRRKILGTMVTAGSWKRQGMLFTPTSYQKTGR